MGNVDSLGVSVALYTRVERKNSTVHEPFHMIWGSFEASAHKRIIAGDVTIQPRTARTASRYVQSR